MPTSWGKIFVSTRLEKQVSPRFFQVWTELLQRGLRPGDAVFSVRGMVAHKAQNAIVRQFLQSDCDTLLTLDSDAMVEADFLERFRTYEPGMAYDVLQAFYPRRGWPPRAIWMKRNALGQMTEYFVTDPEQLDDVDTVGTHACLFRRKVFETMLGDNDPATFDWFYYPRHSMTSEDSAFSLEAKAAGFRLGATAAIRAGHLFEGVTDWNAYQEYIDLTGRRPLLQRWDELCRLVAEFTGESVDMVSARAIDSAGLVGTRWREARPETADEWRAFYGLADNGYLYDLIQWNCSPVYAQITNPLRQYSGMRVLVIGGGLGTEAALLAERNRVDVFDLPGVLRNFCRFRFRDAAVDVLGGTLRDIAGPYDLIVAIDTIEHVHPDEIVSVLANIEWLLADGGVLYCHNNFGQQNVYPMHYDHSTAFEVWTRRAGLKQTGAFTWRRS